MSAEQNTILSFLIIMYSVITLAAIIQERQNHVAYASATILFIVFFAFVLKVFGDKGE